MLLISFNCRVNACLKYGWCTTNRKEDEVSTENELKYPDSGWKIFTNGFSLTNSCFSFGMSQIVLYFVTRTAKDCQPVGDLKSMNMSAENLFRCDHVQSIESVRAGDSLYIRSKCLPEMRKDSLLGWLFRA